mmetsp:Transcript_19881/g.28272  ORF Transcript_19881/g.28272 Transcript_19881/m.28272 type:complete len:236 (+) Transcript_19881:80-787(+)
MEQPSKSSLLIAVGSTNPCKIDAVRIAFEEAIRSCREPSGVDENKLDLVFATYDVPSGVPQQPFGDSETKDGAMNRAKGARELCLQEHGSCDFAVGLEGGVEVTSHDNGTTECPKGETLWCMAWMAILGCNNARFSSFRKSNPSEYNSEGVLYSWGYGKTASFALPDKITELVRHQGMELGQADDLVFNRVNSKKGSGTVGILTNFMINRTEYYVHALKLALIPWIWPSLYICPS